MTTTTRKRAGRGIRLSVTIIGAAVFSLGGLPAMAAEADTGSILPRGHDPAANYRYLGETGWDLSLSAGVEDRIEQEALRGNEYTGELRLGPAVMKTILIGERPVTFQGQWLPEVESLDHQEGDTVMFSTTFRF